MEHPAVLGERPLTAAAERDRVLVVDTDRTAHEALSAAGDGYELLTARTVEDALATVAAESVDCIVSEYTIAGESGLDLLRAVREEHRDLPFVLFTDDGDETVASDAVGAGVTDYLPKARATALPGRVATAIADHAQRKAILGRMTDAFFAVDTDWRLTYVNERGRERLSDVIGEELSAAELVGRSLWEAVPSAVDTQFYAEYHRAMDEQEPVAFEAFYDPTETWFGVRAYPSPTGLSVYFQDVTARKEREETLVDREQALRRVHEVIADKDRGFEEKVDELLAVGRDAVGAEAAALSRVEGDEYIFEIVHDDNVEAGETVPLATTNCERAIRDEETLVLADIEREAPALAARPGFTEMGVSCYLGTPVWVDGEVSGTVCFYDREPRSEPFEEWAVTLVDLLGNWVSYEQERERREAELTRERNRLDDFASLVSHDLRNPLTVALGRLDILRETYDGDPDHITTLETALERIDAIIEDLLVLARSGEKRVEPEPHRLGDVVADAWEATGTTAGVLLLPDEGATVDGDPVSLPQLFENLLRNAVEHGGDDVTVEVGVLPEGDGLYVADDGPGIPPDDRGEVFDSGYTTREEGTGFGLRIVSEVAGAHGWDVRVTDSDAGGARFEITGLKVE